MRNLAFALSYVLFGSFAALSLFWAAVSIRRLEIPSAVVTLGFAVLCIGLIVPTVLVSLGRVTPRGLVDADGTVIRVDRTIHRWSVAAEIGAFVMLATYAVFEPLGMIDIPGPPGDGRRFLYLSIAGAVWGLVTLRKTIKRGGSFIRLTPYDIELSRGWSSTQCAWADITDVSDRREGKRLPVRESVFVTLKDGRVQLFVMDSYTPEGTAMRWLVRHYWQHPERRDELTTDRALKRLENEDFWSD